MGDTSGECDMCVKAECAPTPMPTPQSARADVRGGIARVFMALAAYVLRLLQCTLGNRAKAWLKSRCLATFCGGQDLADAIKGAFGMGRAPLVANDQLEA